MIEKAITEDGHFNYLIFLKYITIIMINRMTVGIASEIIPGPTIEA